jgi:hypothetical protein
MPGESPGRNWDALLRPPTDFDRFRDEQTLARGKRIERLWSIFTAVAIGLAFLGWLALMPLALKTPAPWGWLTGLVWLFSLGGILFIVVVILRRLERLLPREFRALEGE